MEEESASLFGVELSDDDIEAVSISDAELQVIYYVSGYCGHRVLKTVSCPHCVSTFVSDTPMPNVQRSSDFFNFINRGRLSSPSDQLFSFMCHVYSLFCCLKKSSQFDDFLRRSSPANDFLSFVEGHASFAENIQQPCSHDLYELWRRSVRCFFNCLARNLVRGMSKQFAPDFSRKIHKLRSNRL